MFFYFSTLDRTCKKRFDSRFGLEAHQKQHKNELYPCFFCPWRGVVDYSRSMKTHFHKHFMGSDQGLYKCSFCDQTLSNANSRTMHEQTFHERISNRYKCKNCEYTTHSAKLLEYHVRKFRGQTCLK